MTDGRHRNQTNDLGLVVGFPVPDWQPARTPDDSILAGQYCRCEPLDIEAHGKQLFEAYRQDKEDRVWVYLPYGPFNRYEDFVHWMEASCFNGDPKFYAIVDQSTGKACGVASYLRINPREGSIEVGHINYSPSIQNSISATEAMFLMMENAFALGNRRYEWKCNALNERSCNAALRLGFSYEGTFRQMMVVKGQNRDTAWYSILDREWPEIRKAYDAWLRKDNFDNNGAQRKALSQLIKEAHSRIAD